MGNLGVSQNNSTAIGEIQSMNRLLDYILSFSNISTIFGFVSGEFAEFLVMSNKKSTKKTRKQWKRHNSEYSSSFEYVQGLAWIMHEIMVKWWSVCLLVAFWRLIAQYCQVFADLMRFLRYLQCFWCFWANKIDQNCLVLWPMSHFFLLFCLVIQCIS